MVFDPSVYLGRLGWSGPGTGLTSTSRSKPISVLQKNNLLGVGKERETSHPWWDDVFSQVANKLDRPTPTTAQPSLPLTTFSNSSGHSTNSVRIQLAKRNAGLYPHFQRGPTIPGTQFYPELTTTQPNLIESNPKNPSTLGAHPSLTQAIDLTQQSNDPIHPPKKRKRDRVKVTQQDSTKRKKKKKKTTTNDSEEQSRTRI